MKCQSIGWVVVVLASMVGPARAQVSGPTPPDAETGALPPAPPPPPSMWSFMSLPEGTMGCGRANLCKSGLGQMGRSILTPAKVLCGGMVPEACRPYATPEEVAHAMPPALLSPAQVAAARIKADEVAAHERRAAVRYLATKDCHYYPEAEAAILAALRADRVECVRLEAARALANGCCNTGRTLETLNLVVSGSDRDGNPAETSDRVKCLAYQALTRCRATVVDHLPSPTAEPQELPAPNVVNPVSFRTSAPQDPTVTEAERIHAERVSATPPPQKLATHRSVFSVLMQTRTPPATSSPAPSPSAAPAPAPVPAPAPLTPIGAAPLAIGCEPL